MREEGLTRARKLLFFVLNQQELFNPDPISSFPYRFCRILRSHGDFLPSLHIAIHMLKKETGELPIPLAPIKNDSALLRELKELKLEEWQTAHM